MPLQPHGLHRINLLKKGKGRRKLAWIILLLAGLCEIGLVMGLHFSHGFTRLWPSVFLAVSGIASFYLLSVAMKTIPVGTAYAVWTGIGAVGAVVLGIIFLGDPATALRLTGISLVLAGIVLIKLAEPSTA